MKAKTKTLASFTLGLCAIASQGVHAQSSVTIFGVIDANIGSYKGAATGVTAKSERTLQQEAGGMTTSFFGIRGSEDLGGGVKAEFDLQSFFRNDTGSSGRADAIPNVVAADPFFSKSSWVGFSSADFGKVRLGNLVSPLWFNSLSSNAFGDSTVFSPINLVTVVGSPMSGGTNWKDTVFYETPNMSGLTLSVNHSLSEGMGGANTGVRAAFSRGAFATSVAWTSVKKDPVTFSDGTTRNNTKNWQLAASYHFQVVKVFAHLGQIKVVSSATTASEVTHDIWGLSAGMPIGQGSLLAGIANRTGGEASGASKRTVISLAYDYPLSKRTDIYTVVRNDRTRTAGAGQDVTGTSYAVGVRHRF